mmetsp:Transcript_112757/g.324043  ORF Transcript_112757/g.324043 Transcript_112757/m.324043 type:complete len:200 (+) Transcript_112757:1478-2077(+)
MRMRVDVGSLPQHLQVDPSGLEDRCGHDDDDGEKDGGHLADAIMELVAEIFVLDEDHHHDGNGLHHGLDHGGEFLGHVAGGPALRAGDHDHVELVRAPSAEPLLAMRPFHEKLVECSRQDGPREPQADRDDQRRKIHVHLHDVEGCGPMHSRPDRAQPLLLEGPLRKDGCADADDDRPYHDARSLHIPAVAGQIELVLL